MVPPSRSIHCLIRNREVVLTPEEFVRQSLIQRLINLLGYPKELMMLEKGLDQLPHLQTANRREFPRRRADLVIFAPDISQNPSLLPLLLVECKAEKITMEAFRQVLGYNQYLHAFAVALVNTTEAILAYKPQPSEPHLFISGIPSYQELLKQAQASIVRS